MSRLEFLVQQSLAGVPQSMRGKPQSLKALLDVLGGQISAAPFVKALITSPKARQQLTVMVAEIGNVGVKVRDPKHFRGPKPSMHSRDSSTEMATDIWRMAVAAGGEPGKIDDQVLIDKLYPHCRELGAKWLEAGDTKASNEVIGATAFLQAWISEEGKLTCAGLAQWVEEGMPSIEMPHTFAAALMTSSATAEAIKTVRPPWRGFFIEVPEGMLFVDDSRSRTQAMIRRILVTQLHHPKGEWAWIAFTDGDVAVWRYGVHAIDLLPPTLDSDEENFFRQSAKVTDLDGRAMALIGRLIINVALSMTIPGLSKAVGGGHDVWARSKDPRHLKKQLRRIRLGNPVDVDLREVVSAYLKGEAPKPGSYGQFKIQRHGAGKKLIKTLWNPPGLIELHASREPAL